MKLCDDIETEILPSAVEKQTSFGLGQTSHIQMQTDKHNQLGNEISGLIKD